MRRDQGSGWEFTSLTPGHLPFTSHSILPSAPVTIRPQQRIPTMIKPVRITGRIEMMGMLVVALDGTVAVAMVDGAIMETQSDIL